MTLNQIKYFCMVCKYNNISKAAEELYVSQPSVSLAIKELEEEFHEKLFIRNNNKLLLTEVGKILWEMAEGLLSQANMITTSIQKINHRNQKLSIGIYPDLNKWALPYIEMITGELSKKYENLDVELVEISSFELSKAVMNHEVDVLFCNSEDMDQSYPYGYKKICRTYMKVCMSKNHPLAKEKEITLDMLKGENIIGNYYNREKWQIWLKEFFAGCDFVPKSQCFFLQNEAIHSLLVENKGIALARPEVNGMSMEGIVSIPMQTNYYIDILLLYDKRFTLRNVVADFIGLSHSVKID